MTEITAWDSFPSGYSTSTDLLMGFRAVSGSNPSGPYILTGSELIALIQSILTPTVLQGLLTPSVFGPIFTTWWQGLPTTLPSTTNTFWNDGGVLAWT